MKTQDMDVQPQAVQAPHHRGRRWVVAIVAATIVVLLVGLGGVVLAQLWPQHSDRSQGAPTPASGKWIQVLKGYTITSLAAARSDSATIYACAIKAQQPHGARNYTLLHSTDFGAHWQDLGGKAGLSNVCAFAINPTDGNDIYVVDTSGTPQTPDVLKHSTDGGQTWSTITPTLQISALQALGLQSAPAWKVQQITMEGDQLFGVQSVQPTSLSLPGQPTPPGRNRALLHLVTSSDGGYNWAVLDGKLTTNQLSLQSYVVDPTNPGTIYELVGLPIQSLILPTPSSAPHGVGSDLYKTTDGGATWQLLLQGLPYGTQVQLGMNKPNLVYVGGIIAGPRPYSSGPQLQGSTPTNTTPVNFILNVSRDGGTTWQQVTIPPAVPHVQRWFIGADGRAYVDTGNAFAGVSGPITGKLNKGVRKPIPRPQNTPTPQTTPNAQNIPASQDISIIAVATPTPDTTDVPSTDTGVTVPTTTATAPTSPPPLILAYDPTTNNWSQVTKPPDLGGILMVTQADANGGAVLWFMSINGQKLTLYRYVV